MFTSCYLEYRTEKGLGYWMTKSLNSTDEFEGKLGMKASLTHNFLIDSEIFNNREEVIFYAFSQRVKGRILGTNIGNLGVITIYATIVLAIGRTIKFWFDRLSQKVIYDEIPETRDLMELIEGKKTHYLIEFINCFYENSHLYSKNRRQHLQRAEIIRVDDSNISITGGAHAPYGKDTKIWSA